MEIETGVMTLRQKKGSTNMENLWKREKTKKCVLTQSPKKENNPVDPFKVPFSRKTNNKFVLL